MIAKVRFQCEHCQRTEDIENTESRMAYANILRVLQTRGWKITVSTSGPAVHTCPDCPDGFDAQ